MAWFHVNLKYRVQDQRMKWKSYVEQFLHEGVTYGEIETQLATLCEGRVKDYDYDIVKVRQVTVYEPHVKGAFYKVTIEEKSTNDNDVEKTTTSIHYVVAVDVTDAEHRASEHIKNWITDVTIIGAVKTKIIAVWHPVATAWQDDYKSRLFDIANMGHENTDPAQLNLFSQGDDVDANPEGDQEDAEGDQKDAPAPQGQTESDNADTIRPFPVDPLDVEGVVKELNSRVKGKGGQAKVDTDADGKTWHDKIQASKQAPEGIEKQLTDFVADGVNQTAAQPAEGEKKKRVSSPAQLEALAKLNSKKKDKKPTFDEGIDQPIL